jgi:anaerobic selenocysteine-containing dehydrogenase
MVSPMLACEEAWRLAETARTIDPQAVLAIGPVPHHGEDKTFPGGYSLYAEKAPNARGVRRVLEKVAGFGNVLEYDALLDKLRHDESIGAVLLSGNYPSDWVTNDLDNALGERFLVAIDVLPNRLTQRADILLPGASWAEKSGCFENVNNRLQHFEQAIPVIEFARPEGQIALDLAAAFGVAEPARFDPIAVRQKLGGPFDQVHQLDRADVRETDMQYVDL